MPGSDIRCRTTPTRRARPRRVGAVALAAAWLAAIGWPAPARADDPADYLLPPVPWHEAALEQTPLRFTEPPPIAHVFVDDAWRSRYQVVIFLAEGGLIHYERSRSAYSATAPLPLVFYKVYGEGTALSAHGISVGLSDALATTVNGRPVAYVARQGSDAVCFAFVSQFGPDGAPNQMLRGRICRPLGQVGADVLARQGLALLAQLVVP